MVRPAGFASAAQASSASPRNAPPIPRERAPGLPELNCRPESDSMSTFSAVADTETSATTTTNANLRIIPPNLDDRRIAEGLLHARRAHGADHRRQHPVRRAELLRPRVLAPAPLDVAVGQALGADGD